MSNDRARMTAPILDALEGRGWRIWQHHAPPHHGASLHTVAVLVGIPDEWWDSTFRQLGGASWPHLVRPLEDRCWILQTHGGRVIAQGRCGIVGDVPGAAAAIARKIHTLARQELEHRIPGKGSDLSAPLERAPGVGGGHRYGGILHLHLIDPSPSLVARLRKVGFREWDGAWQAVDCPGTLPLYEELMAKGDPERR